MSELAGTTVTDLGSMITAEGLGRLVTELRRRGYRVIAPVARSGALLLEEIAAATELPWGVGVEADGGRYRLTERRDRQVFANAVGPQAWKSILCPPRERRLEADRAAGDPTPSTAPDPHDEAPLALFGLRPCDLRALAILDQAPLATEVASSYAVRRSRALIVVVECTEPASTCFCVSAGGWPAIRQDGPDADVRYDLKLTELTGSHGQSVFMARTGSCQGAEIFRAVTRTKADRHSLARAHAAVGRAAATMTARAKLPGVDLRALLAASTQAMRWNDLAERCLGCGTCAQVCPADSKFDLDAVDDAAGDRVCDRVCESPGSRYRPWLTRRFEAPDGGAEPAGCVGCGRCIAWCPVGIDPTEEIRALQTEWEWATQDE